jgi:hypothetical protein
MKRPQLHAYLEEAVRAGFPLPRTAGGIFSFTPGIAHLNITRVSEGDRAPDPLSTEELSRAERAGRRMAELYLQAFRRFVPAFEEAYLLDTGARIGIRESRRVRCTYVLNSDDVLEGRRFHDAIACCAWPVEEHGADRSTRWVWLPDGVYYQIPFRSLLPVGIDGLLVAGRCASATHEAHASMRVAGTCMAMGQAAGGAAALAGQSGRSVRDVPVAELRKLLLGQGAFLGEVVQPSPASHRHLQVRRHDGEAQKQFHARLDALGAAKGAMDRTRAHRGRPREAEDRDHQLLLGTVELLQPSRCPVRGREG